MKVLVIALLKPSQIKYKIQPLVNSNEVDEVIILRKKKGPPMEKVTYFVLPKLATIRPFYWFLTPLIATYAVWKTKADVILCYHLVPHGLYAHFASTFSGKPFLYGQIDLDIQFLSEKRLFRPYVKHFLRKAKTINVPGSNSKKHWVSLGIDPNKINLLHSTIDTENDFLPLESEKKYDFLYVGTLEKRKQIPVIVEACAKLRDQGYKFNFAIVGSGEDDEVVKAQIKEYHLEDIVFQLGYQTDVLSYYHQSKYFIMASRNEGIPCAMMEAMSCNLIALVPDVADIADVVKENDTGFIMADITVDIVADKMKYILDHQDEMEVIRKNGRKMIRENHSYQSATKKWDELLRKIKTS